MTKILIRLFLLSHLIGDFYFQSPDLAKQKSTRLSSLLLHGGLYFLALFLCILPFYSSQLLWATVALSLAHFLIDGFKRIAVKKPAEFGFLYIVDQTLHIVCILVLSLYLSYQKYDLNLVSPLADFTSLENVTNCYLWGLLLLGVGKPANITIKQLLEQYKPPEEEAGLKNAGAFIGILERIIILLFLSIEQYSAIGLVLTAKSIARYNKIAEDKQFAEYYLLGTLLSTLYVIAAYLLLK